MSADIAIKVRNVSKHYLIYSRPEDRLKQAIMARVDRLFGREPRRYYTDFAALNGVSFNVRKGETVGIIGRNGCGKSTLLQIICGTLLPSGGSVEVNGRIAALLELGAGFNPEFTGRENVYMNAAILGLSTKEINERFDDIVAFADIGQFIDQPVKTYSSGMYVRLAFAVAINVDPDILVIDEALAVGDVAFQRKCFSRLEQIREQGATILFVSHSPGAIIELCDRAILLDSGELLLDGTPKFVVSQYLKLINAPATSAPKLREKIRALQNIPANESEFYNEQDKDINDETPSAGEIANNQQNEKQYSKKESGWYDPNLKSKSIIEYEQRGARIRDVRILTLSGRQVNVLVRGQKYIYEYFVDFEKDFCNVAFGMLIKTISGLELGGGSTGQKKKYHIKNVKKGQTIRVRYSFVCRLHSGAYCMNAGVSAENEEEGRFFLHRILDAVLFRVDEEELEISNGIVDFSPHPEITLIEDSVEQILLG